MSPGPRHRAGRAQQRFGSQGASHDGKTFPALRRRRTYPHPIYIIARTRPVSSLVRIRQQRQDGGVTLTITDRPSDEDRDWIVVSRRTTRFIDPATGLLIVHETVVRKAPPGFSPPPDRLQCSAESVAALDSATPAYTCTYQTSRSITDSERVYSRTGYIEHNIRHCADRYVRQENGVRLYKPYRVAMWWPRSCPELPPLPDIELLVRAASTAKAYKWSYYLRTARVEASLTGAQ